MTCFELKGNNPTFIQYLVTSVPKTMLKIRNCCPANAHLAARGTFGFPALLLGLSIFCSSFYPESFNTPGNKGWEHKVPCALEYLEHRGWCVRVAGVPRVALARRGCGDKDGSVSILI